MPEETNNIFVSQYLNLYESHRKTMILFSGISGAIDEVEFSFGKKLKHLKLEKKPLSSDVLSEAGDNDVHFLIKRGHLTEMPPQQEYASFVAYVEKINSHYIQKSTRGYLMVVPSYYCNLACPYCFQSGLRAKKNCSTHKFMSAAQAKNLFEKTIPTLFPNIRHLNKISLSLYGGEPFLPANRAAIDTLMGYAIKNQMDVSATTNGTMVQQFLKWFGFRPGHINNVQISLDGDKPHHDKSRIGFNGDATFERIIENIHKLIDLNVQVQIRINTHRANVKSIATLAKRLKNEEILGHPRVHVYAWAVHCHDGSVNQRGYLTNWELAKILENSNKQIENPVGRRERRLRFLFKPTNGIVLKRTAFCMRTMPNSYLIDLHGDIYGCYEEAGKKHMRIGFVERNGGIKWEEVYDRNLSRSVGRCKPCDGCALALTCAGGCPRAAEINNSSQFTNDCDSQKECVELAIQNLVKNKSENLQTNSGRMDILDVFPNA